MFKKIRLIGRNMTNMISKERKQLIKKVAACLLAVTVTGVPAIYVNSVFGYLPVIMVVVGICMSYLYLVILKHTLVFEELSDLNSCKRGASVDFAVSLQNKSILIFPKLEAFFYVSDLFSEDDSVTESVITLSPGEKRKFEFSVRFDHIGSYTAGLKKIKIHDLLGLFTHTVKNNKDYRVNVAPKIFDIEKLDISDTALNESERMIVPTVIDGADYAGVREYVVGDPIKTIHWKLSARTENYMTKIFESYGTVGMSIILDFFSPKYDRETLMTMFDSIVETGLSIGDFAGERGIDYDVVYLNKYQQKKKFSSTQYKDYVELIADMPKISTSENETNGPELLTEEGRGRYSHGNISYCSANITDELVNILIELKNIRKNPILFALIPRSMEDRDRQDYLRPLRVLDVNNITYYVLSSAEELGCGEKV